MALNFPNNPTNGQTFWDGFKTWQFNGVGWEIQDDGGGGAFATVAQYRAKAPLVSIPPDVVFAAAAPVVVSGAANITLDFSAGFNFSCVLTANRTLNNPSNVAPGQAGWIHFSGAFSITSYGSFWVKPGGLNPAFAGSLNMIYYQAISAYLIAISINPNLS